jgi:hypothetical protein
MKFSVLQNLWANIEFPLRRKSLEVYKTLILKAGKWFDSKKKKMSEKPKNLLNSCARCQALKFTRVKVLPNCSIIFYP